MTTSARNQFPGRITSVERGAVSVIVKIQMEGLCHVIVFITKESVEDVFGSCGCEALLSSAPISARSSPGLPILMITRVLVASSKKAAAF